MLNGVCVMAYERDRERERYKKEDREMKKERQLGKERGRESLCVYLVILQVNLYLN